MGASIRWELAIESLPFLAKGTVITLELSFASTLIGMVIGLFLALARLSSISLVRIVAKGYIDFFRGTPLLAQLFLVYFAAPQAFHFQTPPHFQYIAGIIALSLNAGAYIAEIFRAGIQSIDIGQTEAAWSVGMTNAQAMRHIVLPQAIRVVIPPMGNELIAMLKDSSLVSIIAIEEMLYSAKIIVGRTYQPVPLYVSVTLMYLCMTVVISWILSKVERRLAKSDSH